MSGLKFYTYGYFQPLEHESWGLQLPEKIWRYFFMKQVLIINFVEPLKQTQKWVKTIYHVNYEIITNDIIKTLNHLYW